MTPLLKDTTSRKRSEQSDAHTALPSIEHRRCWSPEAERDETSVGRLSSHWSDGLRAKQGERNEWLLLLNPSGTTAGFIAGIQGNVVVNFEGDVSEADITAPKPATRIVWDENLVSFHACLLSYSAGSESSPWLTDPLEDRDEIRRSFSILVGIGGQEHFEDGMDNDFSRGITSLVDTHGEPAIDELADFISSGPMNGELAAEALVCIGRIEDPYTFLKRRSLLEASLFSSSHFIRDGALLGLACLDDAHAIPYLKRAIERETNTQLHRYMQQLLRELEAAS